MRYNVEAATACSGIRPKPWLEAAEIITWRAAYDGLAA
jgi:hypothetical protein